MKRLLQGAAALMTIGCQQGDALPLTAEQHQQVEQDLARLELEAPFVKKILRKADPLMNSRGKNADDNKDLVKHIDTLESDLRWYFENDRIMVLNREESHASAHENIGGLRADNFLYVESFQPDDPASELYPYTTATYMHEAAHFRWNENRKEHNDSYGHREHSSDEWREIVLEEGDVSYLMNELFVIDIPMRDGDFLNLDGLSQRVTGLEARFGEVDIKVPSDIQENTRLYLDETIQALEEVSNRGDAEWAEAYLNLYPDTPDEYKFIGVSDAEYRDALSASPELWLEARNEIDELLERAKEIEKEYSEELKREQVQEFRPSPKSRR